MDVPRVSHRSPPNSATWLRKTDTTSEEREEEFYLGALALLTQFCNQFNTDASVSRYNDDDDDDGAGTDNSTDTRPSAPISSRRQSTSTDRVEHVNVDDGDQFSRSTPSSPPVGPAHGAPRGCGDEDKFLPWHSRNSSTKTEKTNYRNDDRRDRSPKSVPNIKGFGSSFAPGQSSNRSNKSVANPTSKAFKRKLETKLPMTSSKRSRTIHSAKTSQQRHVAFEENQLQKFAKYYSRLTSLRMGEFQIPPPHPSTTIFDVPSSNDLSASSPFVGATLGHEDWHLLQPLRQYRRTTGCSSNDIRKSSDDVPGICGRPLHPKLCTSGAGLTTSMRLPHKMTTSTGNLVFGHKLAELSRVGARSVHATRPQLAMPFLPSSQRILSQPAGDIASSFNESFEGGDSGYDFRSDFLRKMSSITERYRHQIGVIDSSFVDYRSGNDYGFRWNAGNARGPTSSLPSHIAPPFRPTSRLSPLIVHESLGAARVTDLPSWSFPVSDLDAPRATFVPQLPSRGEPFASAFALRQHLDHLAVERYRYSRGEDCFQSAVSRISQAGPAFS